MKLISDALAGRWMISFVWVFLGCRPNSLPGGLGVGVATGGMYRIHVESAGTAVVFPGTTNGVRCRPAGLNSNAATRITSNSVVVVSYTGALKMEQAEKVAEAVIRTAVRNGATITMVHAEQVEDVTVFHWETPWSNPRDSRNAKFFVNNVFFGDGAEGFEKAMRSLSGIQHRVLLLGTNHDRDRNFGPDEEPDFGDGRTVSRELRRRGIEVIWGATRGAWELGPI